VRQFEIWWANLPAPAGRRPVLLLSRNDAYQYLGKFIVAEITTTRQWLDSRAGALPPSRHREVKRALGYASDGTNWPAQTWVPCIDPKAAPRLRQSGYSANTFCNVRTKAVSA